MTPERYTSVYVSDMYIIVESSKRTLSGFSIVSPPTTELAPDFASRAWVLSATSPSEEYQGDMESIRGTKSTCVSSAVS